MKGICIDKGVETGVNRCGESEVGGTGVNSTELLPAVVKDHCSLLQLER